MTRLQDLRRIPTALALGLTIGISSASWAQQSGPPVSSGSGSGTGTGQESGAGLGTTGTGMESSAATRNLSPRSNLPFPRGLGDPGSASGTRMPNDDMPPLGGGSSTAFPTELTPGQLEEIYAQELNLARGIQQPGERAMAFDRIARSAIFTNRLKDAQIALKEARAAALQEPMRLVREQRIMSVITTLTNLAEALVREAITDDILPDDTTKPLPGRRLEDRTSILEDAEAEWERAAELALRMDKANFRSQLLYSIVRSQGAGSEVIANQVQRSSFASSNLASQARALNAMADRSLLLAAAHARLIERPIWRDRALVEVAAKAAVSSQFERGLQIARTIPQPEVRTDGLLRIAEAQSHRNFLDAATSTYAEAAQSVAAIPQQDPRTILAGVLIDSLVSSGRFDDARACIILFPDYSRQIVALGAIAQSQGARGNADAARAWIAREGPPEYRPYLYRKVIEGLLAAVDKNRSSALSNQNR